MIIAHRLESSGTIKRECIRIKYFTGTARCVGGTMISRTSIFIAKINFKERDDLVILIRAIKSLGCWCLLLHRRLLCEGYSEQVSASFDRIYVG